MSQAQAQAAVSQAADAAAAQASGAGGEASVDVVGLLMGVDPAAQPKGDAGDAGAAGAGEGADDKGGAGEGEGSATDGTAAAGGEGTPGGAAATAQAAEGGKGEAQQQGAAGTPDKVIQALQQDLAAQSRKMDALLAKIESGQGLTAQEQKQAAAAQSKLAEIRQRLSEGKFDAVADAPELVEALGEVEGQNQELRQQVKALADEVGAMKQGSQQQQAAAAQAALAAQYQGIDINTVFAKALADAGSMMGIDPATTPASSELGKALNRAANNLFHDRAAAAVKAIAAKGTAAGGAAGAAGAAGGAGGGKGGKPTPPVTPGGARVTQPAQVVTNNGAPDADAAYRQAALSLVKD